MPLTASGNLSSLSDSGYTRSDLVAFFNGLASKYGVSVENGDVDLLAAKLMGEGGCIRELGGDPQRCFNDFESQYARRGGPVGQGDTSNVGSNKVGGGNEVDNSAARATTVSAPPAATPPSVGPTGLANPSLPINYATNSYGSQYGYNGVGGQPFTASVATGASGGSNMMIWLLLGGAALAVFFLMRK